MTAGTWFTRDGAFRGDGLRGWVLLRTLIERDEGVE
jgi:hypothetical protein